MKPEKEHIVSLMEMGFVLCGQNHMVLPYYIPGESKPSGYEVASIVPLRVISFSALAAIAYDDFIRLSGNKLVSVFKDEKRRLGVNGEYD